MDIDYVSGLCAESDAFMAELIAANSDYPRFAEALRFCCLEIQNRKFLSKAFLRGFKRTREYRGMAEKPIFDAFVDVEFSIKQEYRKEAEREEVDLAALIRAEY